MNSHPFKMLKHETKIGIIEIDKPLDNNPLNLRDL